MSNPITPLEIVNLYRIWTSIIYRCTRKDNKQYKNYGARGIDICDEWMDFNKFCEDIGKRPFEGCHLDRTDNDKGYFKENCRWVTPKINHRNKRNNRYYETHLGRICQSELIERLGFTRTQFRRAKEKYGIQKLLEMFAKNIVPTKKEKIDLYDIVGKTFSTIYVEKLDIESKGNARYFCTCSCGYKMTLTRFNVMNRRNKKCKSCGKKGNLNPKRKYMSKKS